jgi:hypothetical protein
VERHHLRNGLGAKALAKGVGFHALPVGQQIARIYK